ncbi:MAG: hypothetical protein KJ977_05305, partial [Candidatus Omnitrophica bacterium]|nr:hypothetical protein [Candidatus Omnitrophota bacterium]
MSTDDKMEMADHGEADAATAEGHVVVACLSRLLNLIEATDETAAKRIEEVDGRYCVVSEETGRSFGCYDTKAEAAERLAQVERFAESDKADDGDELDGLDESLVPSDYVSKRDGSRNIRDDEIARLLEDLSEKHPGNVTLTFDCCYSGTATRAGRMLVRGQSWPGDDGGSRRPPV